MTAASRLKVALEIPAVLLFAWYLRVSCSRLNFGAGRMMRKREDDWFPSRRILGSSSSLCQDVLSPPLDASLVVIRRLKP